MPDLDPSPSPSARATPSRPAGLASAPAPAPHHPLPVELLDVVDVLPFDAYLKRGGRMVLYATRGADSPPILDRARSGLPLHVGPADAGALPVLLAIWLGRSLEEPDADPATQAHRVAAFARSLVALLHDPDASLDPLTWRVAIGAVERLVSALEVDDAAGHLRRALLATPGSEETSRARTLASRALIGMVCAVEIATALAADAPIGEIALAATLRDVGLTPETADRRDSSRERVRRSRHALRRHPAAGRELLHWAVGATPSYARFVEEHHERVDGSGYPGGLSGAAIAEESLVVGLADLHVAITMAGNPRIVTSGTEIARILRIAAGRRFPPRHVGALVELASGGRLSGASHAASHHPREHGDVRGWVERTMGLATPG